jgi:hypothetical protein
VPTSSITDPAGSVSAGQPYNTSADGTTTHIDVAIGPNAPSEYATVSLTPIYIGYGYISSDPLGGNGITQANAPITPATAPTCPTSLVLKSNNGTPEPLSTVYPTYKTGIGAVMYFDVSDPSGANYDGVPIQEVITQNNSSCPTDVNLCRASNGLVVGQGGTLQNGQHLDGVQNILYDETIFLRASSALTTGSCSATCTQVISCGRNTLGTFTNSWTLTEGPYSSTDSTPVTKIVVIKQ